MLERFVGAVLPRGGMAVMLSEMYFDESGTHAGSPVMTLAGYMFKSDQSRRFSRDWQKCLDRLGLPGAHMTDCANGKADYAKLTMDERILSEKLLIQNIKRRTVFGLSVSVCPDEFKSIMGDYAKAMSAYTLLLMICVVKIRDWAQHNRYNGKIAYFFEAGHEHSSQANYYMNGLEQLGPVVTEYNYYGGHAFLNKKDALPLQAADMLAWLHRNYLMRLMNGKDEPRQDFVALARNCDFSAMVSKEHLLQLKSYMQQGAGIFDKLPARLSKIYLRPAS